MKAKKLLLYRYILIPCLLFLFSCGTGTNKKTAQSSLTQNDEAVPQNSATDPSQNALIVKHIMGKFDPSLDSNFVKIPLAYADQEDRYMHKEAYEAFKKMHELALEEGIDLKIKSAARNFDYQKGIWERKWTGETILSNGQNASVAYADSVTRAKKILEYSSMPGTSRHHWGTDIDLNAFNNSWFETGEGLKLFNWLEAHAHEFGFCRPYTEKDSLRPFGYNEEKWHWSYMPISEPLTRQAVELMSDSLISGFLGAGTAAHIDVVNKYILGINHSCIH